MNLFGADVTALDTETFLDAARRLFPILALGWLALVVRWQRAGVLLLGVLAANGYVWLETNSPLQRLYAFGYSSDRMNNVALCQVVAAGHSPLHTPQVGQLHFEPFWAVLTALLSGWDTERLLRIYPFLSLAMACEFALSLFFALRPLPPAGSGDTAAHEGAWSAWARALIALFATLLSSARALAAAPVDSGILSTLATPAGQAVTHRLPAGREMIAGRPDPSRGGRRPATADDTRANLAPLPRDPVQGATTRSRSTRTPCSGGWPARFQVGARSSTRSGRPGSGRARTV